MEDKIKNIMINIFNLDLDDTGEELSVETIENCHHSCATK